MDFESLTVDISKPHAPIIIAEIGVNHNCSLDIAKQLVDVAVEADVDVVKFQRFISEEEISVFAEKADYQKETTDEQESQLEMCKALEFRDEYLVEMKTYCAEKNIGFLVTAFEPNSVDWLVDVLGVKSLKIPSSETTNHPMLEQIGRKGVGAIFSTGASTLEEVQEGLAALKRGYTQAEINNPEVIILHCVSQYPAPAEDLNLRAMQTIQETTNCPVGFSDHSLGITADIAATALGAIAIEKHYTLDRNMEGPDHRASLEPDELKALVSETRAAFAMLGDGVKQPVLSEKHTRPVIKKSMVAIGELKAGTVLDENIVKFKRPCPDNAITPDKAAEAWGKTLKSDIQNDQPITWNDLASN